jgi:4-hydroxybenzoate polyprenyltransferase
LPSGRLSRSAVTWFTIVCSLGFLAATLMFLPNIVPLVLALPVLLILLAYSYTKRLTWLAQFWLGMSLALSPVAAWIAIRGQEVLRNALDLTPAWIIGLAVLFWVAGFDMIYACQDFEFDRQAKLKSVPTRFGIRGALRLAASCHVLTVFWLILLPFLSARAGLQLDLGWIYGAGMLGLSGLLVYEHRLVSPNNLSQVNVAFFQVNAVVSIGLFLLVLLDAMV